MKFNISLRTPSALSERVQAVLKDFDMTLEQSHETFEGDIDIEGKEWSIGLIVGSSGSGKSTIAKHAFPENYIRNYQYTEGSVLDDMPLGVEIKDIEHAFTSVGFASPPLLAETI